MLFLDEFPLVAVAIASNRVRKLSIQLLTQSRIVDRIMRIEFRASRFANELLLAAHRTEGLYTIAAEFLEIECFPVFRYDRYTDSRRQSRYTNSRFVLHEERTSSLSSFAVSVSTGTRTADPVSSIV